MQDKEDLINKAKKSGWLDPFFVDNKLWGFEQASDVMPKPLPESFQQKQQPSLDPFPRRGFETLAYLFILDNCIEGRFKRTQDLPFFTPAFGETFSNWRDRQSLSFYYRDWFDVDNLSIGVAKEIQRTGGININGNLIVLMYDQEIRVNASVTPMHMLIEARLDEFKCKASFCIYSYSRDNS